MRNKPFRPSIEVTAQKYCGEGEEDLQGAADDSHQNQQSGGHEENACQTPQRNQSGCPVLPSQPPGGEKQIEAQAQGGGHGEHDVEEGFKRQFFWQIGRGDGAEQQKKRRVDQIPDSSGKLQVSGYPGQNPEKVPSGHYSPQAEAPLSPQHISDDGEVQGEQVEIPDKQEGVSGNNKKSG